MRTSILAALGLVCLLAAPAAFAQVALEADVPFSFIVGNKVMPAGQYSIEWGSGHTMARLHCQKAKAGTFVLANPYGITKRGESPALVFNRYGTKHYLKRIRTHSLERQVPRSKGEREMVAAWGKPEKETVVARTR